MYLHTCTGKDNTNLCFEVLTGEGDLAELEVEEECAGETTGAGAGAVGSACGTRLLDSLSTTCGLQQRHITVFE